ncbi:MAG: K(+)-stimulated pyrophosphate-energized sodium pump [Candidatus Marinamargulisbacteria bacterium]|jgi:K(+)-stimulated pyrophosphate-energized sodium pump
MNFSEILVPVLAIVALAAAFVFFRKSQSSAPVRDNVRVFSEFLQQGMTLYRKKQIKVISIVFGLLTAILIIHAVSGLHDALLAVSFLLGGFWSFVSTMFALKISTSATSMLTSLGEKNRVLGLTKALNASKVIGITTLAVAILDMSLIYLTLNYVFNHNVFGLAGYLIDDFALTVELKSNLAAHPQFEVNKFFEITVVMIGYCLGTSTQAFFSRIGGSIFHHSSDTAAEMVGRMEFDISDEDLRNPATVSSHIGTHINKMSATASDTYEAFALNVLVAGSVGLAFGFYDENIPNIYWIFTPLLLAISGVLATIVSLFFMKIKASENYASMMKKFYFRLLLNSVLFLGFAGLLSIPLPSVDLYVLADLGVGIIASVLLCVITDRMTCTKGRFVRKAADYSRHGIVPNLLSGLTWGALSTVLIGLVLIGTILIPFFISGGLENFMAGIYGTAIASIGLLSTVGFFLTFNSFGGLIVQAESTAKMLHIPQETATGEQDLHQVENTFYAMCRTLLTSVSALISFCLIFVYLFSIRYAFHQLSDKKPFFVGGREFTESAAQGSQLEIGKLTFHQISDLFHIDVLNIAFLIGIMIGFILILTFCGVLLNAVTCGVCILNKEIRRQLEKSHAILRGEELPDYGACIDLAIGSAQRWLIPLSLIAIVTPLVVGVSLGAPAIIGILVSIALFGFLFSLFLSMTGSIWNAIHLYLEQDDNIDSETLDNANIAKRFGSVLVDTLAPTLSILIKFIAIIAIIFCALTLLIGPTFIG